jgi:hypothetical protein
MVGRSWREDGRERIQSSTRKDVLSKKNIQKPFIH